jgi:hypothetical protein
MRLKYLLIKLIHPISLLKNDDCALGALQVN